MLGDFDFCIGLQHANRVLGSLVAEDKRESEHQCDRENQVPAHRSTIPNKLKISRPKNGINSFKHTSGSQGVAGQIQKEIFKVRLPNLHPVQSGGIGREFPEAFVDIVGFDFDDALGLKNPMLMAAQVA